MLTSSMTLGSAPDFSKHVINSELPISAATCNGVAPPAVMFTLPPACQCHHKKF